MVIDVIAERSTSKYLMQSIISVNSIVSTFIIAALLSFGFSIRAEAATRQELAAAIANLEIAANADLLQGVEVINALSVVTAPPQSLTMGIVNGTKGTSINLPVYIKSGTRPVSSVQFDAILPAGITPLSVTPGIAAQAANKSAQGNIIQGGAYRIIIFGINQTEIPSGPVAIIRVSIAGNVSGKKDISIINISGSDPVGQVVPLASKNGYITVR